VKERFFLLIFTALHLKVRNFIEARSFGFVANEAAHSVLWAMPSTAKAGDDSDGNILNFRWKRLYTTSL
jgi:hypothetical protein